MVRKLIAQAYTVVVTMPPDAVETMNIATEIAEHLNPADHPLPEPLMPTGVEHS